MLEKGSPANKRKEFFLRVTMVKYLASVVELSEDIFVSFPTGT
jgi:hypothetical protein